MTSREKAESGRQNEGCLSKLIGGAMPQPVGERGERQQRHHQDDLIDRNDEYRCGRLNVELPSECRQSDIGNRAVNSGEYGAERYSDDGQIAARRG